MKQGSLTNEDVLRSEIPWPAFQNAGIISKEQLEMMYLLDKQTVDNQVAQFEAVRPPSETSGRGRGGRGASSGGSTAGPPNFWPRACRRTASRWPI